MKHDLINTSLKQIQISTFQIKKEFIIKKKLTKEGKWDFIYIRKYLTYKIRDTLCISNGNREMFTQLNYLQKA